MTESLKNATPVFLRSMRRTWLTASGHVAAAQTKPAVPTDEKTVEWEAHVVDSASEGTIESYPSLTGTTTVTSDADTDHEIIQAYIQKCRFVDGSSLDVTLLQNNLNAGIWDIDINVREPATA